MALSTSHRVLLPISIATCLSLLGDTTLYTVLPTHTTEAGISLAMVGILLSANRWIRLPLNGPAGFFFEKLRRKPVFVLAMFAGATSTALYAIDNGFTTLMIARLIWGISWVGIWVGGNIIVMDISQDANRGKWLGLYRVSFYIGAGGGAALGGLLTDSLGYHNAMAINAGLTLLGAVIALLFLPETKTLSPNANSKNNKPNEPIPAQRINRAEFATAIGLLSVNRLVQGGLLLSTLALFVQNIYGEVILIGGRAFGASTLTGIGLGMSTLVAAVAAPTSGVLSDKAANRWRVAGTSLIPGILGFISIQIGSPAAIIAGLIGTSIAAGSSANLSSAIIGDLGYQGQHGRRLGSLFTFGDLASAIGPPLAFWLQPMIGLQGVYWIAAGVLGLMSLLSFYWTIFYRRQQTVTG